MRLGLLGWLNIEQRVSVKKQQSFSCRAFCWWSIFLCSQGESLKLLEKEFRCYEIDDHLTVCQTIYFAEYSSTTKAVMSDKKDTLHGSDLQAHSRCQSMKQNGDRHKNFPTKWLNSSRHCPNCETSPLSSPMAVTQVSHYK